MQRILMLINLLAISFSLFLNALRDIARSDFLISCRHG